MKIGLSSYTYSWAVGVQGHPPDTPMTLMDLLDPLGTVVDVVLETSHNRDSNGHQDLYREHIDMPVLNSILWEYEDLLLNDGCTGIAVLNPGIPQEVQFDEHKLLIVYGEELTEFEGSLINRRIDCDDQIKFVTEGNGSRPNSRRPANICSRLSATQSSIRVR